MFVAFACKAAWHGLENTTQGNEFQGKGFRMFGFSEFRV